MKSAKLLFVIALLVALSTLACSLGTPPAEGGTTAPPAQQDTDGDLLPTATTIPPTIAPSPTPMTWEGLQLELNEKTIDSGIEGVTITMQVPHLIGIADPRVEMFNSAAESIVDAQVQEFLDLAAELIEGTPDFPWYLSNGVRVSYLDGGLVSLMLDFDSYTGGAHPYPYSEAVNYDLNTSHLLTLDELFTPGADYLNPVAGEAQTQLEATGYFDFPEGADPTLDNYQDWNITSAGLLVHFDVYQVAPYAAGPQTVAIPYPTLAAIIDPVGPIGDLAP
ncbi:MAG: DUF3298 and DUF4163 domain-containing protein [Anaerolineales bacterium]|nr:DUF3298 and DUF4163 domain-containing protein [Anaerolineales bacterium]